MHNLIVLCQRCLSWVETHSDTCPECAADVFLDMPDINRDSLAEILGTPISLIGPVRIERYSLPNYGFLIGTSAGILYLPRLHRRLNGAWESVTSQRLPRWWPFQGDASSPRFLNWLRRPFISESSDEILAPAEDQPGMDALADRFMDSPGAFFTRHQSIKSISGRWRLVKLERMLQRSISIVDETEEGSLRVTLDSLRIQATTNSRERSNG